jgi:DNA-directed RNA polymerase specialized sigma24 family protein
MTTDKELELLYKQTFPAAAKKLGRLGCDADTAKDIFHDALIIYLEKKQSGDLQLRSSPAAYIAGITRLLWLHHFREQQGITSLDAGKHDSPVAADYYRQQDEAQPLLRRLRRAGAKCLELLQAFYYDNMPLTAITQKFGFSSVHSASVQKYKCLEKVRSEVTKETNHEIGATAY